MTYEEIIATLYSCAEHGLSASLATAAEVREITRRPLLHFLAKGPNKNAEH